MRSVIGARHLISAGLLSVSLVAGIASAGDAPAESAEASAVNDPHAGHHMGDGVRRSEAQYLIPGVTLTRDDGKAVAFPDELDDGRPVVLNFIYTSCTSICPLSSRIFEQFQEDLGEARNSVHLVSISIDPEQDTPARLRAYAAQYHAAHGWDHYSGSTGSIISMQKAFNAYRGDKMSHSPITLMRAAPGKPWARFDGFARAGDLTAERNSWEPPTPAIVAK